MGDSESVNQDHGRNTFLSRVFGLQPDDITTSIRTGDMSRYPLNAYSGGSEMFSGSPTSSRIDDDDDDDEGRVPESDQQSSSGDNSDDIKANDDVIEDVELTDGNGDNYTNSKMINTNYSIFGSLRKVGQQSSDEEDDGSLSNEEEDIDEEDEIDEIDADEPLFVNSTSQRKQKRKSSVNFKNGSEMSSLLFQRILNKKDSKSNGEASNKMFTSSNQGNHNYKYRNGHDLEGGVHFNKKEGRRNSLFGSHEAGGHKSHNSAPSKGPNLLKNISILNNTPSNKVYTLSPKERALWKWANVENLDVFLQEVYKYYLGSGFSCIVLRKLLNLTTLIFVVYISTYLGYCIDYSKLPTSSRLSDIIIDQCYTTRITGITKGLLWVFYVFVGLKVVQFYFDLQNLTDMHNFYNYLLGISDNELQTIPWQNIIQQLMYLKDQNALTANVVEVKAKNKIDPLVVANRIMRKDNYLIALYNENILDLSLPIPFYKESILTKTLEWNINLCIIGFAFNESGFIKQSFLKKSQHQFITEELRKRFMLAGFLNIILSPFLVTYFVLLYFLRYFNEFKTSPGTIGARQYTPMAEWTFREFNELYHIFQKRLGLSTVIADKYINQFPKESTDLILKFISFISGSFVAVLMSLTLLDSENFLNFEVTKDRSVLFYITVFGAIWSVCRNSISDEYKVYDPDETIKELSEFTHYLPKEWEGKHHTEDVKQEFCKLYNIRLIILLRELASLVLTPFILWFSLPACSDRIVDFFSDSSTYIDGLGYVCKYATFGINQANAQKVKGGKRHQDMKMNTNNFSNEVINESDEDVLDSDSDSEIDSNDKMMRSYMYFMEDYENSENAIGKNQLPRKKYKDPSLTNPSLNTDYSWRKQFQPGQRPELFRIGKHALQVPTNVRNLGKKSTLNSENPYDNSSNLGESFINPTIMPDRDLGRNGVNGGKKEAGMLRMVKDYYKTSDIGR
ncbi:hypothetical protein Kpol_461p14 [Vanderwaltozyma polyspora DSM 70294]|uniref:Autophagy-related protein 9 n=1 Tax=Vanderwaltozyma polyspora (strain ATCC 22028 / DSM 70294 / BCRC 21397 / CBS 2163 / NBRC 10782 / NRRL Y-8283 / UCD 57-17) TaxID=436907 RepID=ATG9_VANPO|nr:uncharacterized protein Kpol_461p14 [Vanderwaltozyma polyspora DSM 70294]A7TR50.1 RecName: Full=Autophagy-related protein 9 [Vanderwaltozyma polyspora DSM 70294]EDO15260.1 hypothetical protein Kpol_461p14 [Vanderwaltozyma polyspora DSM 70294]